MRCAALGAAVSLLLWSGGLAAAAPVSPQAADFFEAQVRPLLAENCYSCHGPKRQQAGLRLDGPDHLRKGSDAGPVVVPGDPEKSLLIEAVRYQGELKMPPKGKLPARAIDALTTWVRMGAPWPGSEGGQQKVATRPPAEDPARTHWAFQPVRPLPLPAVRDTAWPATPIDRFILAKLEANDLRPAPPADRRTLLRRVTFDLVGLPPTAEEIEAFCNDRSPDAFARVVDRLLASPHYGERWGRHWLDVARYADTKGYVFQEERRYPYAYTYRDYVIRAFNEDLPYDQFIVQQLAADRLPLGDDRQPLAAMGFLTLGRRFLNNTNDIIDDRIDVVTRGLLGLTVGCARCHDHKFDPIPQKDYYSLYGVFASSVEPRDLPLLEEPERDAAYLAFEKELKTREQRVTDFLREKHAEALARYRTQVADYLLAVGTAPRRGAGERVQSASGAELNFSMVRRWQDYLSRPGMKQHPVLSPWLALAALPEKEFAARAPAVLDGLAGKANPLVLQQLRAQPPASLREAAQRFGELLAQAERSWQDYAKQGSAPTTGTAGTGPPTPPKGLPDAALEEVRQVLYAADGPLAVPQDDTRAFLDRAGRTRLAALRQQVEQFKVTAKAAPPRAMVLHDGTPQQPRVFLRGNPNNLGEPVPRQFLAVLSPEKRQPFTDGSGRLELARAIASPANPLTARVLVNRVWLHHFGTGLVRTPSDFGVRSDPPTHPELLDYLAARFVADGWSLKKLHRVIVLSQVYQQASENPAARRVDPDNRLLGRMNRHRLDFEQMRDALLAVAGALDRSAGGKAVDLTAQPFTGRRTVYGFIDRQNLPGLFRTFDFASPDTTSPQRYATTVPQQALFLMNSPFVVEQARRLAGLLDRAGPAGTPERIQYLYRRVLGRAATANEVALGQRYLDTAGPAAAGTTLEPWARYAQVLLLANEFAFVD